MSTMDDLIESWSGECVVVRHDAPTGTWIFIAIHDRRLGMAMGGCRMKPYPSKEAGLRDAQRLAEGMTLKWAGIEFPFGGGKSVLAIPRPMEGDERRGLLERFGDLLEGVRGMYGTGVDLGTTPADMNIIGTRGGQVAGRDPEHGGAGDPGPWTALGVFMGIEAAAERALGGADLGGRSVLVQGVGGVGAPLARLLADAGARVLISDMVPDRARSLADELGGEVVDPAEAYDTECDIFAPCAVGGVMSEATIPRLRCRVVAGSANNQLEEERDSERLHERGIIYVPDFIINAGGAVAHGLLEFLSHDESEVEPRVRRIRETVGAILDEAERSGTSPLTQAKRGAAEVLRTGRTTVR